MRFAASVSVPLGLVALLGVAAAFSQCQNLSPLAPGICGNGVVDPGEDCDGFVDAAGEACGAPSAGALACRFECVGTAACPTGYKCGVDQICRQPSGSFSALGSPLSVGAARLTLADFNDDGFADLLTRGPVNAVGGERVGVTYLGSNGAPLGNFAIDDRLIAASVADVNGDGYADLVAALHINNTAGVSVFLGQNEYALALQGNPSALLTSSVDGGVSGDVRVLSISGFPEGPRLVYFAGSNVPGSYAPGIYLPTGDGLPDLATPDASKVYDLPEGPDEVVGNVVLAQLRTGTFAAAAPCPSIVYQTTAGLVRVVNICESETNGSVAFSNHKPTTVVLPSTNLTACLGAAPKACGPGVVVADVNGDANPDLILTVSNGSPSFGTLGYETLVAYGTGGGTFYEPGKLNANGAPLPGAGPYSITLQAWDGVLVPTPVTLGSTYAAGDFNEDGLADFVSVVGEYATVDGGVRAPQVTFLVSRRVNTNQDAGSVDAGADAGTGQAGDLVVYDTPLDGGLGWQSAVIADFNADGRPDVVGGSNAFSGLDFYDGVTVAGLGYVPHQSLVSTAGPVSLLTVGDFDGDNIDDVAFSQADPANDGSVDLEISYGRSSGAPTAPVTVNRYHRIEQIASTLPYSELDVVGVPFVAPQRQAGSLTLTRFATAAGGRPPLSSQALSVSQANVDGGSQVPVVAVAGSFANAESTDAGTSVLSVAAVGEPSTGNDYLWLLRGQSPPVPFSAVFDSPVRATNGLPSDLRPAPVTGELTNQSILAAAAPLVPNHAASLVVVAADTLAPTRSVLLVATVANGSSGNLVPSNYDAGGGGLAPLLYGPAPDGGSATSPPVAEDGQLALRDLDGDGAPDLVLLTGTATATFCSALAGDAGSPVAATARSLLVYWGDGKGGFDVRSPVQVAHCGGVDACGDSDRESCPQAFTTLQTTASAVPTLAYVTHAGAYFAQLASSPGHRNVGAVTATEPLPTADAGAPGYTGIAAGDINGDGVDDFAVVVGGTVYLYAGAAVQP